MLHKNKKKNKKKYLSYGELLGELKKLTPWQLAMPATYSDHYGINRIRSIHILCDDHVIVGDGLELKSSYLKSELADPGRYTIVPAGTLLIEGE